MMNRIAGRFFIVSMLLAAAAVMAPAQVPTGTINGIVSDPHDAVVPNAHVFAVNKAQGVSRESSSNADGLYVAGYFLPGEQRAVHRHRSAHGSLGQRHRAGLICKILV